ncbi:hypothetical protein F5Y10DRAFT_261422 [Nemania abortiva]|nr:hypothetical protein F5Y10DRAFT_261422 [Nemania abortiva]
MIILAEVKLPSDWKLNVYSMSYLNSHLLEMYFRAKVKARRKAKIYSAYDLSADRDELMRLIHEDSRREAARRRISPVEKGKDTEKTSTSSSAPLEDTPPPPYSIGQHNATGSTSMSISAPQEDMPPPPYSAEDDSAGNTSTESKGSEDDLKSGRKD